MVRAGRADVSGLDGIRLQDDTAFIRQVSGVNFATPDRDVQVGFESTNWSAQFAVTNGTAGGSSTPDGKQYSLRAEHVQSIWRVRCERQLQRFHRREPADAEHLRRRAHRADLVARRKRTTSAMTTSLPNVNRSSGLLEANWAIAKGHNLQVHHGIFPNRIGTCPTTTRIAGASCGKCRPVFQFLQLRVGGRNYDGIPSRTIRENRSACIHAADKRLLLIGCAHYRSCSVRLF